MSHFVPITIINDNPPTTEGTLITPHELRHFETQYERAIEDSAAPMRTSTTETLRAQLLTSQPTGATGRIYYNTSTGQLWGYDGTAWKELGE